MKHLIRKMLVGNHTVREYTTVTIPDVIQEQVYLEAGKRLINVSTRHWLLCIEPATFGIWLTSEEDRHALKCSTRWKLYFGTKESAPHQSLPVEAVLDLTRVSSIEEAGGTLFLLNPEKSHLYQLNAWKRYILFHRYYRKNGLTYSNFQSYVAAYSYPRRIRIISFRQDDYYNIFPMDLLGDISASDRFVFGLRHTNIALSKIIATGKLVVAEAPYAQKETIYRLGAHHSSSPPPIGSLPFKTIQSSQYGFYIPDWAISYREIAVLKTLDLGSHMLLWGACSPEQLLQPPADHLYLEHFLHYLHQNKHAYSYQVV